jgi:type I site-specific restriction endonuclease
LLHSWGHFAKPVPPPPHPPPPPQPPLLATLDSFVKQCVAKGRVTVCRNPFKIPQPPSAGKKGEKKKQSKRNQKKQSTPTTTTAISELKLRKYQDEAIQFIDNAQTCSTLRIELPCGTGKTVVAMKCIFDAFKKESNSIHMFVVPTKDLAVQTAEIAKVRLACTREESAREGS